MPMKRALYPANWAELALAIKEAAGWRCQECGRQCYRPGERGRGRRVLTVAHLDQNPGNNDPSNLKALCSVCHLNFDRAHNVRKAKRKRALKQAGQTLPLGI